ncbi:unnamed protein product [Symbiodinium microadriaticum]|nr:unnamed protein product [Symbiodinium microadriaticum]
MAAVPAADQPVPEDEADEEEEEEPFDPWAAAGQQAGDAPSPTDAAEYRQFLQFLNRRGGARRGRAEGDDEDDDDKDSRSNAGPPPTWATDNGEKLLKAMDTRELYGDDEREDMLNSLFKITHATRRQKNESHKEFFSRWELAIRKLSEHNITLPPEYLGFLLTMALQLNQEEVKVLMNFTRGKLSQKDVNGWVRVHETVRKGVESDGSEALPSSLETPTQRGLTESAGGVFKDILYKSMIDYQCQSREVFDFEVGQAVYFWRRGLFDPDNDIELNDQSAVEEQAADVGLGSSSGVKREAEEHLGPPGKRSRMHLIEVYHLHLHGLAKQRQKKESKASDFKGADYEKLQTAILKEIINNLGTQAYEPLSREDSQRTELNKPEKIQIMESRYVITIKLLEPAEVSKAESEGVLLEVKDLIEANRISEEDLLVSVVADAAWGNAKEQPWIEDSPEDYWQEQADGAAPAGPDLHDLTEYRTVVKFDTAADGTMWKEVIEDKWSDANVIRVIQDGAWTGSSYFPKSKKEKLPASKLHSSLNKPAAESQQPGRTDRDLPRPPSLRDGDAGYDDGGCKEKATGSSGRRWIPWRLKDKHYKEAWGRCIGIVYFSWSYSLIGCGSGPGFINVRKGFANGFLRPSARSRSKLSNLRHGCLQRCFESLKYKPCQYLPLRGYNPDWAEGGESPFHSQRDPASKPRAWRFDLLWSSSRSTPLGR